VTEELLVSKHDWRHGLVSCQTCRRAIDANSDSLRLHALSTPRHSEAVVEFECPRCDTITRFRIEEGARPA
jgi:predicted RNA-binding Zn-ribbon protein involved in translation (DUF1610 family)